MARLHSLPNSISSPNTTSTTSTPDSRVRIASPPPTYNGGNKLSDNTFGQVQLQEKRLSSQSKEGLGRCKDEGLREKGTAAPTSAVIREGPQAQQRLTLNCWKGFGSLASYQQWIPVSEGLVQVISHTVNKVLVDSCARLCEKAKRENKQLQVSGQPPNLSNKA